MKLKELVISTGILGLMVLVVACSTVQAAGVGVSPPVITVPDAQRGVEYERFITVFNTADDDGAFDLNATGPGSEWIAFYRVEDLLTPLTTIEINGLYIGSWDKVPGNDSERLLEFLQEDHAIDWARDAAIQKSDDCIRIVHASDWAEITLDLPNDHATVTISDGQVVDLQVQEQNSSIAIYRWHSEERIVVKITIAADAPNGSYNSTLFIQRLTGTEESITIADTEIGYPLRIMVKFQNDGNVLATPTITCCITPNDTVVHAETSIKPDKLGTITVPWNTTGHEPGDYNISLNLSLGGEMLATEVLPFSILPYGTFTRTGALKSVYVEGEPQVNRVIKVIAEFENTGRIDTTASFVGEVYCDGEFIDLVESREKLVTVGETYKIVSYYKITMHGDYLISGMVLYDGRETETIDYSFTVPEPQ